jgi:hypothetical protein
MTIRIPAARKNSTMSADSDRAAGVTFESLRNSSRKPLGLSK